MTSTTFTFLLFTIAVLMFASGYVARKYQDRRPVILPRGGPTLTTAGERCEVRYFATHEDRQKFQKEHPHFYIRRLEYIYFTNGDLYTIKVWYKQRNEVAP